MLKQYRFSKYGTLSNKCLPQTIAITDNSKFNVGTMVNVYVDLNFQEPEKCKKLTNHSNPKDIKAFDKNREICLNQEANVELNKPKEEEENDFSTCKSCSLKDII
jgi:hypothetical protein